MIYVNRPIFFWFVLFFHEDEVEEKRREKEIVKVDDYDNED